MTLDRLAWFIGQIARPFAIMIGCASASVASVIMALRVSDGTDGSLLAGAIWLGAGTIFIGKAAEEFGKSRNAANVEIAKAGGDRRKPQEVIVTNPPEAPVNVEETHP